MKIADFGLARVFSGENGRLYSHQVATRCVLIFMLEVCRQTSLYFGWFVIQVVQSPRVVVRGKRIRSRSGYVVCNCYKHILFPTDWNIIRAVGCIFGELLNNSPLFPVRKLPHPFVMGINCIYITPGGEWHRPALQSLESSRNTNRRNVACMYV